MNDLATPKASEDSAWASINVPLNINELKSFCQDLERLFRINPMLEFRHWEKRAENRYRMEVKNISQETHFELETELSVKHQPDGITIYYDNGLKKKTELKFEATTEGSRLTIIDDYAGLSEEERQSRLNEVDKSLINWADYLQRYILMWHRWSRFGLWRWYMRRIWQPMKPIGRRITYTLLWISVVEVALITLGVTIYFIEYT